MQFQTLILIALVGKTIALTTHHSDRFSQWQTKHGIKFKTDQEQQFRKIIFQKKADDVDKHNSNPKTSYKKGLNKFSHLTKEQFVKTYLGRIKTHSKVPKVHSNHQIDTKSLHLQSGTGQVNWTDQGYTTNVKNQGACGSCWTFSTTGAFEGVSALNGNLQSFSEQQVLDCASNDVWGMLGCDGGNEKTGLDYAIANGLVTQDEYPYTAVQGNCEIESGDFKISSYAYITDCASLDQAILSNPVSIAVMASSWGDYESGIFDECDNSVINHAVLLSGRTSDAYIVKNSFGPDWGEYGYIRLRLDNCCGVCQEGYLPIA